MSIQQERVELSAVLPVWTGGQRLDRLLPPLIGTLQSLAPTTEVVIGDATGGVRVPEGYEGEVRVIQAEGPGYGDALKAALAATRGDAVVTLDADSPSSPEVVRALWANRGRAEVLIGSRYLRASVTDMGLARRWLSRALNRLYRIILALPFRDLSSGFRLYPRAVLEDIGPLEASGLDILQEIVVKAAAQGWRVGEIPMYYRHPHVWGVRRYTHQALDYLRTTGKLFALRNSVKAADYDNRAFDSWIPLQRYWQRARYRIIRRMVEGSHRILDVGCGSSRIIQHLPGAVGMDLQLRKLRWLRGPGRQLLQGDMNRLPFSDGTFDAVICSEVIEHIPREDVRIEELVRVLQPGGTLVLGTPDYSRRTWLALEWTYKRVFPNGYAKEHINPYTRDELAGMMRDLGLSVGTPEYVGHSEMIFAAKAPLAERTRPRSQSPAPSRSA